MTSDFYFTVTSWFPGNVCVKPYSKHSAPRPLAPTALQLSCVVEDWTFGQAWNFSSQFGGHNLSLIVVIAIVTQPMLQPTSNQMELRLMVSKSFFNVDSKNGSENVLHHHSWKNHFFQIFSFGPPGRFWKKKTFFQEWRWRNFSHTFLESTSKMDLETINLSSVWFGVGCNIGWVTSDRVNWSAKIWKEGVDP